MTKASFVFCVLSLTGLIASCGGGDSKSGSGSAGAVADVNYCIDYRIEKDDTPLSPGIDVYDHIVTNTCDFDVNIGLFVFGFGRTVLPAGQSARVGSIAFISDEPVDFIACRPPAVPLISEKKGEFLFCFGG